MLPMSSCVGYDSYERCIVYLVGLSSAHPGATEKARPETPADAPKWQEKDMRSSSTDHH